MRPGAEEGEGEAAPSAPAAGAPRTIGELRIEGAGIHSVENPERDIQSVYDFAKSLSESTNFYDKAGVVIDVPPSGIEPPVVSNVNVTRSFGRNPLSVIRMEPPG